MSKVEPADPAAAAEVFFDGGCPLCRAEIDQYRRLAEGVAWRDVAAGEAPPEVGPAAALARFHARRADGRLVSGFAAFLAVWRASPRLAPLARALDRQPFLWAGEATYRVFLRVRPLWRRAPQPPWRGSRVSATSAAPPGPAQRGVPRPAPATADRPPSPPGLRS